MQRSLNGLLRSLLYQVFRAYPDLIDQAFPNQDWMTGGPQYEFPQDALREALRIVLQKATENDFRLLFFIDGLDEFGDRSELDDLNNPDDQGLYARNLIDILRIFYDSPAVKLCVSSRPLNAFKIQFGQTHERCFHLHELTKDDIKAYIHETLGQNETYRRLASKDPEYAALVAEMIEAAQGVFLWVYLASNSLLEGITNADRIWDLRKRLRDLPHSLGAMYARILSTIEPRYRRIAARTLLLVSLRKQGCHVMHYLCLDDASREWSVDDLLRLEEQLPNWVNARCKCLLEVSDTKRAVTQEINNDHARRIVRLYSELLQPIHRTVVEYLNEQTVQRELRVQAKLSTSIDELMAKTSLASIRTLVLILEQLPHLYDPTDEQKEPKWAKTSLSLLEEVARFGSWTEDLEPGYASKHWTELELITRGSVIHGEPLLSFLVRSKLLLVIFECHPSPNLRIIDLAIVHNASKLVKHELDRAPALIATVPGGLPPLYLALMKACWSPEKGNLIPPTVELLLERGADPNEPCAGSTPWKAFLMLQVCFDTVLGKRWNKTGPLVWDFLKHGADLTVSCHLSATGISHPHDPARIVPADGSIRVLLSDHHEKYGIKNFSLSAAAIVRYVMEEPEVASSSAAYLIPPVAEEDSVAAVLRRIAREISVTEGVLDPHNRE